MIPLFFARLEDNSFVVALGNNGFVYDVCSVLHYFCVFVMVGTMALVDLRVMGLCVKGTPILQFSKQMFPVMWGAFAIAMVTGVLEFLPDGGDFSGSHQFQLKTLFIALSVFFALIVQAGVKRWSEESEVPGIAKVLATLSLLCFLASILFALNVAAIDGLG
jgi:hypothetical protein